MTMTDHSIKEARDTKEPDGGQGDTSLLADPHRAQSDCKMISRAIRERWPTTDRIRSKIVNRAEQCIDDPTIDPDTFCSVGRLVLGMEAQNQADDHLEEKHARLDSGQATEGITFIIERDGGEIPTAQSPDETA